MRHDVFVSHATATKPTVERLCRDLLTRGVKPWFDKWDLSPGRTWQRDLEEGLAKSRAVVVCLGEGGIGRWQAAEVRIAVDRAIGDATREVFPVWLPGAEPQAMPVLLAQFQAVDLREGWEDGVEKLARALLGETEPLPAVGPVECPYRGMAVFDEAHARWMFGRQAEVEHLLAHLRDTSRFLPLVGASGSGKSSLVRAGLVPAVRAGELDGSYDWRIAMLRPGPQPLRELATATLRLAGDEVGRLQLSGDPVEDLVGRFRQSDRALSNLTSLLAGDGAAPAGILVGVDQFEELFTEAEDLIEARQLVRVVLEATGGAGRTHVVVTLRADFIPASLQWPELARALDGMRVALPAMAAAQVRDAIVRPALSVGARVDDAVVAQLVEEVADEVGSLPLLQHCLVETWAHRDRATNTLTWAAYERAGKLKGAIAGTADGLLEGLDEAETAAVRRVMGRLVHLGEGTGDTRRTAPLAEFTGADRVVLDALVERRLVTLDGETTSIAHEALLREWQTLQAWLTEDRGVLRLRQEVTTGAQLWASHARDEGLLWRGARLHRAVEVLAADDADVVLTPAEQGFLDAGVAQEEAEADAARRQEEQRQEAIREREQERLRAARRLIAALVGVVVVVVVGLATTGRQQVELQRMLGELEENLAVSEDRGRAQAALRASAEKQPVAARWLHASVENVGAPGWRQTALDLLQQPAPVATLRGHTDTVYAAAFSPDGQHVVTGSDDGTARVWRADGTGSPVVLEGHTNRVNAAAFSPDGQHVVTGSWDDTARVWRADGTGSPVLLEGHTSAVHAAAFSPDGQHVVTGSWDNTARVLSWSTHLLRQALVLHVEPCLSEAQRIRFLAEPLDEARARYLGCLEATGRSDDPDAIVDHVVDPRDNPHLLQPPQTRTRGGWARWLAEFTAGPRPAP